MDKLAVKWSDGILANRPMSNFVIFDDRRQITTEDGPESMTGVLLPTRAYPLDHMGVVCRVNL